MTDPTNPPAYTQPNFVQGSQVVEQNGPMIAIASNGMAGQNPPIMGIQPGYPFQMCTYPHSTTVYGSYHSNKSRRLGITQIVLGALCIVFNSVAIGFGSWSKSTVVAVGIWGGILFIINGAFGISAAQLRTKCKITTFLILSIISASIAVALFICAVTGAKYPDDGLPDGHRHYWSDFTTVATVMNSVLAVLAVAEAVAATWGSVLGCKVFGCCRSSSNNQQYVMPGPYPTMQGGQPLIVIPMGQLNFGGQLAAYAPGYTTQQMVGISAPPYPFNYGQVTTPLVSQTTTVINQNEEKVPL